MLSIRQIGARRGGLRRVVAGLGLSALIVVGCGEAGSSTPTTAPTPATQQAPVTEPQSPAGTDTVASTSSTAPPPSTAPLADVVAEAGRVYYEALESGDFQRVQDVLSSRCQPAVSEAYVAMAAAQLEGYPATVTVLSVGVDTASVLIDSDAVEGNSGQGTQFRLEDGRWLWDGCP